MPEESRRQESAELRRGQTSAEYLFIVVSIVLFVALVFLLVRGNVLPQTTQKTSQSLSTFLNFTKPYLFFETFDDVSEWKFSGGTWTSQNAEMLQSDTGTQFKLAYTGSPDWYNYAFEVQFQKRSGASSWIAGVGARLNSGSMARYTCYATAAGQMQLLRYSSQSSSSSLDSGFITVDDNWHALAIAVSGSEVSCFYDGVAVASYSDSAPLVSGEVSLEAYNVHVAFDDAKVWPQEGPVPLYATPSGTPAPTPTPAPPVISSVSATVAGNTALVRWQTNIPADAKVEYGLTTAYGSNTSLNVTLDVFHQQLLSGLLPGTRYHYRVWSCAGGLCSFSDDYSFVTEEDIIIPTPTPLPPSPPVISNVKDTEGEYRASIISWNTDIPADGKVEYGLTSAYGSNTTLNPSLETLHIAVVSGLLDNTLYHYRVWSCASGVCSFSSDYTFTTCDPLFDPSCSPELE